MPDLNLDQCLPWNIFCDNEQALIDLPNRGWDFVAFSILHQEAIRAKQVRISEQRPNLAHNLLWQQLQLDSASFVPFGYCPYDFDEQQVTFRPGKGNTLPPGQQTLLILHPLFPDLDNREPTLSRVLQFVSHPLVGGPFAVGKLVPPRGKSDGRTGVADLVFYSWAYLLAIQLSSGDHFVSEGLDDWKHEFLNPLIFGAIGMSDKYLHIKPMSMSAGLIRHLRTSAVPFQFGQPTPQLDSVLGGLGE